MVFVLSVSLAAAACGKSGKAETRAPSTSGGSAGAPPAMASGGSASEQPSAGTGANLAGAPPGSAGDPATDSGGARAEMDEGTVVIEITGLPQGVEAEVLLAGPEQLEATASATLVDVAAGRYTVTAARVYAADPIVRTAYDATVTPPDFVLDADGSQAISITYGATPGSHKLWNASASGGLVAFDAGAIVETGIGDATVSISKWRGRGLAFDRDGHVWTSRFDTPSPDLLRLPATSLGASREFAADVSITLANAPCRPFAFDLAFDGAGNLWLCSACSHQVVRVPASELGTSGDKLPDARFAIADPEGLAFDRDGNLWVNNYMGLSRFDAARLGTMDPEPPDLQLSILPPSSAGELRPTGIVFDGAGNLWSLDFPNQRLFRVAAADLTGKGMQSVRAAVAFRAAPSATGGTPAFDESGGLWLTLSGGTSAGSQLVRFGPEQLAKYGDAGYLQPEVQVTSRSVGWAHISALAFFPAPRGLPLYHSLPAP